MLFLLSLLFATKIASHLTADEARALQLKGEAVLIDVRGSVPYGLGHIEGAVWMPLGLLHQRAGELPQDKIIVAYCTCKSEETSLEAATMLRGLGFENVAVITGGYPAWVKAGYPTAAAGEVAVPAAGGRQSGRLAPPAAVGCDRNKLTVYAGRVTKYSRKRGRTSITIATDWDTTETVVIRHPGGDDPSHDYLVMGTPFTSLDWNRIESKKGVLHRGLRANAWVCAGGRTVVDWQPDTRVQAAK